MTPKIVLFGAPSGVGKSAVTCELARRYPELYQPFPSIASRAMREGETEGNPYHFVTEEQFKQKIQSGEVFEYTQIHGDYRGMSEQIISDYAQDGKILINDVDYLGVIALNQKYGKNVMSFFIWVSKKEAKRRAKKRGDKEEYINFRQSHYEKEMETAKYFDTMVTNKKLDKCVKKIHKKIQKRFKVS